ncbi:citrulline utilization hydrolase CtlX [Brumimicrobium oceani]|uniref:Amidinotransferase n=1 Tax=Brumimicrobium oceani TaxID=2100725 RepID=A0A2U2XGF1_9FLAO|nr:arginine deiminase-related protein [Brumimicrobium oceani]PWH86876.1 amidinotransferase [Brumimicrobium oceani]
MQQITNQLLMIRPADFRMNEETAVNNYFQQELSNTPLEITELAQKEFDEFVNKLKNAGIQVKVINDLKDNNTPDSIFPNNWISFHENGTVALYPMFAENRRRERRMDVIDELRQEGIQFNKIVDYTAAEKDNLFLEGTGSLLLDRVNKKVYCALSVRADKKLIEQFCKDFHYSPILFTAYQTVADQRKAIYHTNVMMALGESFAVICLDTIDNENEKQEVIQNLKEDNKAIIEITEQQMHSFAGNMLQVKGYNGQKHLVMSQQAFESLNKDQINEIKKHCSILSSDLKTIETLGGGSARCMMAEVFK